MTDPLASSIGKTKPHSITFEVSDHFLEQALERPDEWSQPVRFRFEKHDYDEGWDLVLKTADVPA